MSSDSILVVAAEASSCMYAKNFIEQWSREFPSVQYFGVGDKEMQSNGMDCLGLAEEMAVVGLQEVLAHWKDIKTCFLNIVAEAEKRKPKFALLLDYPGFNLRLAKKLKELGIPVVYYISPQLWAWKKGRVEQVRRYVDDMMVVFPFEVDFYQQHGIKAHFVGHPLLEVVEQEKNLLEDRSSSSTAKVLGLMPGSRKSEIRHNLRVQLETAQKIKSSRSVEVVLLAAPTLNKDWLLEQMGELADGVRILQDKPTQMIQSCDFILSASGTATLQVALMERPMVVMYRMNSVTAFLAKLLVNTVEYFCIVNLIAGKEIVPELFQNEANPERLSQELLALMEQDDLRKGMLQNLKELRTLLGEGEATKNLVTYLKEKYVTLAR